MPIGEIHFS